MEPQAKQWLLEAIEAHSAEFRSRLQGVDSQGSELAACMKLYAAIERLRSATKQGDVEVALIEICSNLLACEELALVEIDRATGRLIYLAQEGLTTKLHEGISANAAEIDLQIRNGNMYTGEPGQQLEVPLGELGITAFVPLWSDPHAGVALILFHLLPQRQDFGPEDHELLHWLSLYAGPSLRSQQNG